MRLLLLTQHFPPEPASRVHDLTRHLVDSGHEVSVVTTFPSYGVEGGPPSKRRWRATAPELGASVTRVFSVPRGRGFAMRLLSYASFAACGLFIGMLFRRRPDVVYAYHPPLTTGLAAALYSQLRGVPFVYDVQDLWPEAIVAAGFLRQDGLTYRLLRRLEDYAYSRATLITVISRGMRDNLLAKGVAPQKVRIVSNWGQPEIYFPEDASDTRARLGWQDRFVVLLAGNLGLTHGLETVLAAARQLSAERRILFVFLGDGSAKAALVEKATEAGLHNVRFLARVPPVEAARLLNAADVTLLHLKATAGCEFSVPHRIFASMLCGKPIIAASMGSTADLVRNADESHRPCGWVCQPSDESALARVVLEVSRDLQGRLNRGRNALHVATSRFQRVELLRSLERAILDAGAKACDLPLRATQGDVPSGG